MTTPNREPRHFYNPVDGGFYSEGRIFGWLTKLVNDPEWQRPEIEVSNPDYDPDDESSPETIMVPDSSIPHPQIEVANTAHKIPVAALSVEITASYRNDLLSGEANLARGEIRFDESLQQPVLVDLGDPIQDAAQEKRAEINALRASAINGGADYQGNRYDTDAVSRANITGAATMALVAANAGQPFSITWTLADNTTTELDGAGVMGLATAVGAHIDNCHQIGRTHKDALSELVSQGATAEEIKALDVTAGWPE